MKRRDWLLQTTATATALCTASARATPRDLSKPHEFKIEVRTEGPGRPINRMLLGQNVQWTDGGDDMLGPDGQQRPVMMDRLKSLRPTSLRFPGGAQSDSYRWKNAIGALSARRDNLHFHGKRFQRSLMGTHEFLELCEAVGAQPFITVNTVTGKAEEAAEWLKLTNVTGLVSRQSGKRLPRVPFWEIGNEPYLKEGDESQRLSPAVYVERANDFIRALRAVDPTVRIGVPIRTPTFAGLPATPYPRFAHDVLTGVREPFDFISNHNAYMPYLYDAIPDKGTIYWGTMGAVHSVAQNLDETAALIRSLKPGWQPVQAITEYNALFSLGKGESDNDIASPLGAMYVADVVRMFAGRDDLLLAQYWSLSGNWKFGAIASAGYERPSYIALQLLEDVLRGARYEATLACGTFNAPRAGAAAAVAGLPLITNLVTREADTVRVMLINKDIDRAATGSVHLQNLQVQSATVTRMVCDSPMRVADREGAARRQQENIGLGGNLSTIALRLPPASVSVLALQLRGSR